MFVPAREKQEAVSRKKTRSPHWDSMIARIAIGYQEGAIPPPPDSVAPEDREAYVVMLEWLWGHSPSHRECVRGIATHLADAASKSLYDQMTVAYNFSEFLVPPARFNPTRVPGFPAGELIHQEDKWSGRYRWNRFRLAAALVLLLTALDALGPSEETPAV